MINPIINKVSLSLNSAEQILLQNIEFTIEPNSVYTIIGKNGSGKSTIAKLLIGMLDRRFYNIEARVIFNNTNILEYGEQDLLVFRNKKVRCLFQDPMNSFDPLKKFSYYFSNFTNDKIETEELVKYFLLPHIKDFIELYPYEVSGGMAQRIAFILTLLSNAEVLILDEPTSGIDAAISNLLLLKLKEYTGQKNNSVLLITQDLLFAEKVSNKIALLDNHSLTDFLSPAVFFQNVDNEIIRLYSGSKEKNDV